MEKGHEEGRNKDAKKSGKGTRREAGQGRKGEWQRDVKRVQKTTFKFQEREKREGGRRKGQCRLTGDAGGRVNSGQRKVVKPCACVVFFIFAPFCVYFLLSSEERITVLRHSTP